MKVIVRVGLGGTHFKPFIATLRKREFRLAFSVKGELQEKEMALVRVEQDLYVNRAGVSYCYYRYSSKEYLMWVDVDKIEPLTRKLK